MVPIKKINCPAEQIAIKCPFKRTPTCIVIHNTANDADAENEIAYMHRNDLETSFHYAVDDRQIIQGIDLDRNAWHAGDGRGKGNMEGIGIEICYSKSGGERFRAAQENAAELTASLLRQYGWGLDRVTKHQDYSGKNCPQRTLEDYGWDYFLDRVRAYLNEKPAKKPSAAPHVIYAAYTDRWWEEVTDYNNKNTDGYAGVLGNAITGIRAKLTRGHIRYRAHLLGGDYLPWVTDSGEGADGYAGIYGKTIDGIQMQLNGLDDYVVEYRVAPINGRYFAWVRHYGDGADGYAGLYGKAIDRIQIRLVPKK